MCTVESRPGSASHILSVTPAGSTPNITSSHRIHRQNAMYARPNHDFTKQPYLTAAPVEFEKNRSLSFLGDLFLKESHNLIPAAEYSLDFSFG